MECDVSEILSSSSIDWIGESLELIRKKVGKKTEKKTGINRWKERENTHWVVCIKFGSVGENLVRKLVQILSLAREPGHCILVFSLVPGDDRQI